MNNLMERVFLFNITVPVVILSIFWPINTHILLIILFGVFVTLLGSYELNSIILHKGVNISRFFLPAVNLLIYLFAYFYANNFFGISEKKYTLPLFCLFLVILLSLIYAKDILSTDFSKSLEKISITIFGLLYIGLPSFFLPFLLNISFSPADPVLLFYNVNSGGTLTGSFLILYILVLIWTNDIFAYVFGMWLGRNNVIGLSASPKKSWAGYIGGYFSVFAIVGLYYLIFNRILNFPPAFYIIPPVFTGFLVPIGDLVESVVKRSVKVKDSGSIIMGRGGVLDSVDTILYVIPIFFICLQVYFSFIAP